MARIAIATTKIELFTHTFVRRHVAELYGGDTVVISTYAAKNLDIAQPVHVVGKRKIWKQRSKYFWQFSKAIHEYATRRRERKLVEFLRRHDVSTVLCEFGFVTVDLAEMLKRNGISVYGYFRGSDASRNLRRKRYVRELRKSCEHLSGVLSVSQFLLDNLKKAGFEHPRSIVVPSGVDTNAVTAERAVGRDILTVGRLVEKKAPFDGLAAFAAIADETEANWNIIGSGDADEEFQRRVKKMGLSDRVKLLGRLPHKETLDHVQSCAAVLQPYRTASDGNSEGMPTILQEAMAAGRRIVTTHHAGVPEHLRHERTGLLYKEGDVTGLADGLRRVLAPSFEFDGMGARARAYAVENLDVNMLLRRVEMFIDEKC